ncbi:hypothetical protein Poli38472_004827 [Pythium oligandrum]|uniref:Uncharacterized protein n=1 Tax=Pythium oligandrum TaxID=41045 RepID=A0A8K1FIH5_PYTOL|nr:hypothetical protein Poli38472_004827 [Pythium oligandrum]|eukprot:TMW59758.1 hypothetical protein Poli38472_004827 [Pythium oligandrum]
MERLQMHGSDGDCDGSTPLGKKDDCQTTEGWMKEMIADPSMLFLVEEEANVLSDVVTKEDDLFRATDELCDSTERLLQELLVGEKTSDTRCESTASVTEKPVRENYLKRQKQEIEFLRDKIHELEAQMEEITQKNAASSIQTRMAQRKSVWEGIARRQRDSRLQSETENAKLRGQLEGQLKLARGLEKILRKRPHLTSSFHGSFKRRRGLASLEDPATIFQRLLASVYTRPFDADRFLKDCGLDTVEPSFDDVQVHSDEDEIRLEVLVCREFPFSLQATADAMWKCSTSDLIKFADCSLTTEMVNNKLCHVRSTVELQLRRTEAILDIFNVGQRFDLPGRVVFAWESIGFVSGSLLSDEGFQLREYAYIVIQPSESSSDVASNTLVKGCRRVWPEMTQPETKLYQQRSIEVLLELLMNSVSTNLDVIWQQVENMLVEGSLRTKTVWEAVAKRQRDASQRSMVENMKLHEELQIQMKITRSLEKLLRRRQNSALASKWRNHTQPRVITSTASVFQSIQANLAARPVTVDEWMHNCGLNQAREDLKSVQVRVGSTHDTFLEMLICRVFPFPFERVGLKSLSPRI